MVRKGQVCLPPVQHLLDLGYCAILVIAINCNNKERMGKGKCTFQMDFLIR